MGNLFYSYYEPMLYVDLSDEIYCMNFSMSFIYVRGCIRKEWTSAIFGGQI